MAKALLISLRDAHDAMAAHERRCFEKTAGIPEGTLPMHHMQERRPERHELEKYDTIFFGGSGAYSVNDDQQWIRDSIATLLDVVDLKIPSYASCFGFQGLAVALGGEVINDEAKVEMGSTSVDLTEAGRTDALFKHLPAKFWVQEGHHDRVSRMPSGVQLLVTGDFCYEQAFRVEGAPFWASQFHPELTVQRTIDRFHHYAEFYLDPSEVASTLKMLESGLESPEVGTLLSRLMSGEFAAS